MYIDELDLKNMRTFTTLGRNPLVFVHPDRDFRPPGSPPAPTDTRLPRPRLPNVTLLLGDNGSGKTTVLRAIAASAFGPAAKDLLRDGSLVRHGEERASITARLKLHEQDGAAEKSIETVIDLQRKGERLGVETRTTAPAGSAKTATPDAVETRQTGEATGKLQVFEAPENAVGRKS